MRASNIITPYRKFSHPATQMRYFRDTIKNNTLTINQLKPHIFSSSKCDISKALINNTITIPHPRITWILLFLTHRISYIMSDSGINVNSFLINKFFNSHISKFQVAFFIFNLMCVFNNFF